MGVLEDIQSHYPTLAFLVTDPEVGPLLREAVDPNKGFSPQTFQSKLYQTNWFKSRASTQREYDILRNTDPGTFRQNIDQYEFAIRQKGISLGIVPSGQQTRWLAHLAMQQGLEVNSPLITQGLLQLRKPGSEGSIGGFRTAARDVQGIYIDYHVPLSSKEMRRRANYVAAGTWTLDDIRAQAQTHAMSLFPHLKVQLRTQSMEQIFAGHKAVIGQELDLSPEQVDLTRGRYKRLVDMYNPYEAENKHRSATLYEAQTFARQDPRYWQTTGGQEKDSAMASFMSKTFGRRA